MLYLFVFQQYCMEVKVIWLGIFERTGRKNLHVQHSSEPLTAWTASAVVQGQIIIVEETCSCLLYINIIHIINHAITKTNTTNMNLSRIFCWTCKKLVVDFELIHQSIHLLIYFDFWTFQCPEIIRNIQITWVSSDRMQKKTQKHLPFFLFFCKCGRHVRAILAISSPCWVHLECSRGRGISKKLTKYCTYRHRNA